MQIKTKLKIMNANITVEIDGFGPAVKRILKVLEKEFGEGR